MKVLGWVTAIVATFVVVYHGIHVLYPLQLPAQHIATHLLSALLLLSLGALRRNAKAWLLIAVLMLFGVVGTIYVRTFYWDLVARQGFPNGVDMVMGSMLIIATLELCRRVMGPALPLIALLFITYAFFGSRLPPGIFHSIELELPRIIGAFTTDFDGILGLMLEISAYYVFLFVVFGGLLQVTAAPRFFNQIGIAAGRKLAGGPAMTAVIGSSLVATLTGTPSVNIIITGSYTIPLMKKVGYRPEQAAAIEGAAGTGSQIMPPVMAATAFLMSGITGIPYATICVAAFLPAVLYYISVGMYVHFTAMKLKIKPTEVLGQRTDIKEILLSAPSFVIPLCLIIYLLLKGFSPMYVALWAAVVCVPLGFFRIGKRPSLTEWGQGLTTGAVSGATVAVACATIGIIVKVFTMTGLGVKLPVMVLDWSHGSLVLALLLVGGICLFLGTGLPTTPAYVIVAMVGAPVLVKLGLSLLQAHLFVLYFAVMSMVTPPVAPSAVIASQLAGAGFFKTAVEMTKCAVAGFLVPFIFIASPMLLFQPDKGGLLYGVAIGIGGLLSITCIQIVITSYYVAQVNRIERGLFLVCGLLFFTYVLAFHSYLLLAAGVALFVLLTFVQLRKRHSAKAAT